MAVGKFWCRSVIDKTKFACRFLAFILLAVTGSASRAETAPALPQGVPYGVSDLANRKNDRDHLQARLSGLTVYAADFVQQVYGARGELLEASTGRVLLQRPSFKWVVNDPYPQIIVTRGDRLELYDPDLEQVTIRSLDDALRDTPVSLLTRDDVALDGDFQIVRIADEQGESYLIDPRATDSLYRQIQLHFAPMGSALLTLSGLDILDQLGQRTEIRFEPDVNARAVADSEFLLELPPGTDVIGD